MLSLWTFLALSVFFHFPQAPTTTLTSKNTFAIHLDPSVNTEELQVRYFMTGDFGGLGGFQVEQSGEHRIVIQTEEKGMAAKTLKIVFYAPHCQIQTISVDELSENSRKGNFHCTPLGDLKLQGKFSRSPTTPDRKIEVQILYLGYWGHSFFGIADGIVLSFNIAKSFVEQDGSFQVFLPNFAENGGLPPQKENACFSVLVSDADSGYVLAELKPPAALSRARNLKILPSYPQRIDFDADWSETNSRN
jgi:hypothetical protein